LSTQDHLDLERLKELIGYRYASIREHHCAEDSWEWVFADPRRIHTELDFSVERGRVLRICLMELHGDLEFDFFYYSPGRSTALFGWSSNDGWRFPPQLPVVAT
jgi:hypothetical protein